MKEDGAELSSFVLLQLVSRYDQEEITQGDRLERVNHCIRFVCSVGELSTGIFNLGDKP